MENLQKELILFIIVLLVTLGQLLKIIIEGLGKKKSAQIACSEKNFLGLSAAMEKNLVDVTKAINLVIKNRDDEVLNKVNGTYYKLAELHDWHSREDPITGVKVWYTHSIVAELNDMQKTMVNIEILLKKIAEK